MYAKEKDDWSVAASHPQNRRQNCCASANPLPYHGVVMRPDLRGDSNPRASLRLGATSPRRPRRSTPLRSTPCSS
eukprot:6962094-Alexandrium_andersonii.AAC.1